MGLAQLVTGAIVPVVVLLAVGYLLKSYFLKEESVWRGVEKLSYYLFTPALFISSIAKTDLSHIQVGPLVGSLVLPVLFATCVACAAKFLVRADGPSLTSMIQGSIRINTYVGLIIIGQLYGGEGIAAFALATAVSVPTVNVISVTALSKWGVPEQGRKSPNVLVSIASNPLIGASVIGVLISVSGLQLPSVAATTLSLVSQPALVVGTLISGAALQLSVSVRDVAQVAVTSLIKLIILPLSGVWLASQLGINGVMLAVIAVLFSVPTATSAYILARMLGGNSQLMASITGVQTILSIVTTPLMLYALLPTL